MLWLLSLLALASPRPTGVANGGAPSGPAGPVAPRPGGPGPGIGMSPRISGFAANPIGPTSRGNDLLDPQAGWRTKLTADWAGSRWAGASTPELEASLRGGESLSVGKLVDRMGRDLYVVPLRTDRVWDPSGTCATQPARTAQRGAAKSRPMGAMVDPWFGAVGPTDPRGVVAPGQGIRARVDGVDQVEVRVGPPGTDWTDPTAGVLLGPAERTATSTEGPLELAIRPLRRTSDGPRPAVWLAWGSPETCGGEEAVDLGLGFEAMTIVLLGNTDSFENLPPSTWEDGALTATTLDMSHVARTADGDPSGWAYAMTILDRESGNGYLALRDTGKDGVADEALAAIGLVVSISGLDPGQCATWAPTIAGPRGVTPTRTGLLGAADPVGEATFATPALVPMGNGDYGMGVGWRFPLTTVFDVSEALTMTLTITEGRCP